jgi:hypothetical protein
MTHYHRSLLDENDVSTTTTTANTVCEKKIKQRLMWAPFNSSLLRSGS